MVSSTPGPVREHRATGACFVRILAVAMNADGSMNSSNTLAALSLDGFGVCQRTLANPLLTQAPRAPAALVNNFACSTSSVGAAAFTMWNVEPVSTGQPVSAGEAFGGSVYANRGQRSTQTLPGDGRSDEPANLIRQHAAFVPAPGIVVGIDDAGHRIAHNDRQQ